MVINLFMDKIEFANLRKRLEKTQKQMAQLLGTSLKAIHSYEQGWRNIPIHVERQMLFLLSRKIKKEKGISPCWVIKSCPLKLKQRCPAWEFRAGEVCWFINGTLCQGKVQQSWKDKMKKCRECAVFQPLLVP